MLRGQGGKSHGESAEEREAGKELHVEVDLWLTGGLDKDSGLDGGLGIRCDALDHAIASGIPLVHISPHGVRRFPVS